MPSTSRRTRRPCRPSTDVFVVALAIIASIAVASSSFGALPITSDPTLHRDRMIRTRPFLRSNVFARDVEGSAYVARDRSLWIADDNGRRLFEVNPRTGALKRVVRPRALESAPRFRRGGRAGAARTQDLESLAYDAATDSLFAFSGSCCSRSVLPTVFRLKRRAGRLRVESFRPLRSGTNFTGAAWNRGSKKLLVTSGGTFRTYAYRSGSLGPRFRLRNVRGVTGMGFSRKGRYLFVVTKTDQLRRVAWRARRPVPGWTFNLERFGVKDARGVDLIRDRFFVLDGYDGRRAGDPRKYAVVVFSVT
jgi:hypothetical protein